MGCVACHACHGCVTDFRPILGNPMEVTHVTSPGHVYIFPHSGNLLPLARISTTLPPYHLVGLLVDPVADLMSAGPNGPCPYPGEPSVTLTIQVVYLFPFHDLLLSL